MAGGMRAAAEPVADPPAPKSDTAEATTAVPTAAMRRAADVAATTKAFTGDPAAGRRRGAERDGGAGRGSERGHGPERSAPQLTPPRSAFWTIQAQEPRTASLSN